MPHSPDELHPHHDAPAPTSPGLPTAKPISSVGPSPRHAPMAPIRAVSTEAARLLPPLADDSSVAVPIGASDSRNGPPPPVSAIESRVGPVFEPSTTNVRAQSSMARNGMSPSRHLAVVAAFAVVLVASVVVGFILSRGSASKDQASKTRGRIDHDSNQAPPSDHSVAIETGTQQSAVHDSTTSLGLTSVQSASPSTGVDEAATRSQGAEILAALKRRDFGAARDVVDKGGANSADMPGQLVSSPATGYRQLIDATESFWETFDEAVDVLQAGRELRLEGQPSAFVAATADQFVLFSRGQRQFYDRQKLPRELVRDIVRIAFDMDDVANRINVGAYLFVSRTGSRQDENLIRGHWQAALAASEPVQALLGLLED